MAPQRVDKEIAERTASSDPGTPAPDPGDQRGRTPGGSIRQNGVVKVYGVNRYVDPADSTIMHERHAIYRLEQQPSWVTRSPQAARPEVLLGPIVGLKRPEYAPEPLPGEAAQQIVQARHAADESAKAIEAERRNQEKLADQVAGLAKQTAETQQKLATIVSLLNERVKRLEGDNGNGADGATDSGAGTSPEGSVTVRGPQ